MKARHGRPFGSHSDPNRLTQPQLEKVRAIAEFTRSNGYPPSVRDIRDALGLASTNAVLDGLRILARKGAIIWTPAIARGVVVTQRGYDWIWRK